MNLRSLRSLWQQAWSLILVEMSHQELSWLVCARNHISLLAARRTTMIVSRVRMVAGLFALLTPLWIFVDIVAFPREVWGGLVTARLLATAAFAAILLSLRSMNSLYHAYRALTILLAVPTAFFLFSYHHMAQFDLHGLQAAFAAGYAFLPFVMLAGLSVFPLTLIENISFAMPMLVMQLIAGAMRWPLLEWPTFAGSFWLLVLIAAVSTLAGLSQLAFIIVLVREAMRDALTGCYSRRSGEQLLDVQFSIAQRNNVPLAIAFIDLDHFKSINDTWGHDAGDRALTTAADAIHSSLRGSDILIRWGGEEFLVVLPGATLEQACIPLQRLRRHGFGKRPDGEQMTASIGVAERGRDQAKHWQKLIEIADARMYAAKQGGRDRITGCDAADA